MARNPHLERPFYLEAGNLPGVQQGQAPRRVAGSYLQVEMGLGPRDKAARLPERPSQAAVHWASARALRFEGFSRRIYHEAMYKGVSMVFPIGWDYSMVAPFLHERCLNLCDYVIFLADGPRYIAVLRCG